MEALLELDFANWVTRDCPPVWVTEEGTPTDAVTFLKPFLLSEERLTDDIANAWAQLFDELNPPTYQRAAFDYFQCLRAQADTVLEQDERPA